MGLEDKMDRDEVIRLAREAEGVAYSQPYSQMMVEFLVRFAALVQQAETVEPAAWQERHAKRMFDGVVTEWTDWYPCAYRTPDEARTEACEHIPHEWRPLYTAPQRQPLTEEQIIAMRKSTKATDFSAWSDSIAFARAIERAHRIGGQDDTR